MQILNIIRYYYWKMSLDGVAFFKSSVSCLNGIKLSCMFGGSFKRDIQETFFLDTTDNILYGSYKTLSSSPESTAVFIPPEMSLEQMFFSCPASLTIFYLSNKETPKEKILKNNFITLCSRTDPYSFFILDEQTSEIIKNILLQNIPFRIIFEKHYKISTILLFIVFTSLTIITGCILIIFYLICCIYSSINPIITEYELRRFKLIKYKNIDNKDSESCLICFDNYCDEDDIRVLFCNHYFHQKCVDKWLCEQSSKCPYCRYTNKSYDAV